MRILFVLHQFFPEFSSGTEQVTFNLAKAMQRLGHYVHVLTCRVSGEAAAPPLQHGLYKGIPVTGFPLRMLPTDSDSALATDAALSIALEAFLDEHDFDFCHVTHCMRMACLFPLLSARNIPYALTLTDFYLACHRINLQDVAGKSCSGPELGKRCARRCGSPMWNEEALFLRHDVAREILARSQLNACPSAAVQSAYQAAFPDVKFAVIPHGINFFEFSPSLVSPRGDAGLVLGFLGTVTPVKGLDVLVRAFVDNARPDMRLLIAGPIGDKDHWEREILPVIADDPRINVLGLLEGIARTSFYRRIDLLALPSRVPESFSLVVNEAHFCQVPVLVSDLGAPKERVQDGVNGRVLPAGDLKAWGKTLACLGDTPDVVAEWRKHLPLPYRIEEEAFIYNRMYSAFCVGAA
ncbi:MAG: glycosyltransferase [Gammaproteobacteria bacterium]|nr:glycosyltransferase [Gammaproteobacteria bacterium]